MPSLTQTRDHELCLFPEAESLRDPEAMLREHGPSRVHMAVALRPPTPGLAAVSAHNLSLLVISAPERVEGPAAVLSGSRRPGFPSEGLLHQAWRLCGLSRPQGGHSPVSYSGQVLSPACCPLRAPEQVTDPVFFPASFLLAGSAPWTRALCGKPGAGSQSVVSVPCKEGYTEWVTQPLPEASSG